MTNHDIKIWPEPFAAVLSGAKTYEIRIDDRGFKVGDRLRLMEWSPEAKRPCGKYVGDNDGTCPQLTCVLVRGHVGPCDNVGGYTGRSLLVDVTYLTPGGAWGLPANLCVMAIRRVEPQP